MVRLSEIYAVTRRKLDRELKEREVDFLKWIHEKHIKEEKEETSKEISKN